MAYDGLIAPNLRITNGLSRDMAFGWAQRVKSSWALVQDDPECAMGMAARGIRVVYRQSGDGVISESPDSFAKKRIHAGFENYRGMIWIHGTNEIDPSKEVDEFNREVARYVYGQGYRTALFNHSSNKNILQWDLHRKTISERVPLGDMIGFHLYDDYNHRDGLYSWQQLKNTYGGLWGCTEFAFIRNLNDADHGYRNWLSEAQHRMFWKDHLPFFYEQRIPMFVFSLENWQANPDGQQNGFGIFDNKDISGNDSQRGFLAEQNDVYQWRMPIVVSPKVPVPTEGGEKAALAKIPGTYINVRDNPVNGLDVGDMMVGDTVVWFPKQKYGDWVYIIPVMQVKRPVGIFPAFPGWVSLQGGNVKFVSELLPPTGKFTIISPLEHGVITARFNQPRDYGPHEGTDWALAPNPCSIGTVNVRAVADGVVDDVRDYPEAKAIGKLGTGYGLYVRIKHVDGFVSWLGHLSAALVCEGDTVKQGQPVGILGTTGNSTGYHSHLTLQHLGKGLSGYAVNDVVNPEDYLVNT